MVVHTFNPSTRETETGALKEFEASLSYIMRFFSKSKHTHTHKPTRVDKDLEKSEPYAAGENEKWCSYFGKL
jgi:hypothetical protein